MLHDLFERLDERYPWLARWLGGRLDIQVPAITVSLLTHLALLLVFAMIGYGAYTNNREAAFRSEVVDTSLSEFETLAPTELAQIDNTLVTPVAGSFAPKVSPMVVESPLAPPTPPTPAELKRPEVALGVSLTMPGAPRLDKSVSIQGSGAEHVGSVEGAVDRIAIEILRRLEKGRTLVVWAFDASGSLQAERERLSKYIDDVYKHIEALDHDDKAAEEGLLTSVVGFGKDRKILCEPTSERQTISSAISAVPLDETGIESTFQTVADIIRRYGRFQKDEKSYRTMIVVVTDEVGNDQDKLEGAVALARKASVPVYVLGSPALFGRVEGFMDYKDPKTGQVHHHLPVEQGPETAVLENIHLPFWYDGPQFDYLDSGFGFWALSRLAGASGGIYFITRMGPSRVTFDPAGMREYRPDWVSKDRYMAEVGKHPVREAVMLAAQIAHENLPGQPELTFPPADTPQFKDAMTRNQATTARVEYTVDASLVPISAAYKKRDHEKSRRWMAHYDLMRARLLAIKLRCHEYNAACGKMKKDPKKFADPKHNAWKLFPDKEVRSSEKAAEVAREVEALLKNIIKDHPGTPWALLAQRELKDPFGFRWEEIYVPPPPPPGSNPNPKPRPNDGMNKPPEPPKL